MESTNIGKTPLIICPTDKGIWMPTHVKAHFFLLLTLLSLLGSVAGQSLSTQPVKFDVPAILAASVEAVDFDAHDTLADQLLQIAIPVSSEIRTQSKQTISAFRFDIFWNQVAYPVQDYSPKTQTISEIQGEITTETAQETKSSFGLNLNADLQSIVSGEALSESGTSDSVTKKFTQLPSQSVLVASGTSHRGTGVFFRFDRSSQTALEGGRQLMAQFLVPPDWRAGILRVNCFAIGTTSIFGSWENPFETSRTFVVPVYRQGDSQAKAAAVKFAGAEQRLRLAWRRHQASQPKPKPLPFPTFLVSATAGNNRLPQQWAHLLIQTGNDDYLEKYRSRLPLPLQTSADNFVAARQALNDLH